MLAYTYPLADLLWTMLEVFLFIVWLWLLFIVFADIFRSHDMNGWVKALWVLFVIVLPLLGILVYLIARGDKMHEHEVTDAEEQKQAFDAYVRQAAGTGPADELAKLADLKSQGLLTEAEFESQKAKILAR
ncbi:MAG: SHOCT domain-containing protein [Acidimicrobiales bacterium]|jgi:magnesium-transporting ATPase (P-type)